MNLRTPLAAILALSGMSAFGQTPEKITYSTVAVPIGRALKEISNLSGAKLEVAPRASGEIVVISVKDVSLADLMAKLAGATSGEWISQDGVQRLNYSSAVLRKQEAAEVKSRLESIKQAIQKLQTDSGSDKASPQLPFGISASGPLNKALVRIAAKLDVAKLAALENGDRIVFSTNPTAMQYSLPRIDSEITQLLQEHNAAAVKQKEEEKKQEETSPKTNEQKQKELQEQRQFAGFLGPSKYDKEIVEAPAKVLIVATRGVMFPGAFTGNDISLQLKMYDRRGVITLAGSMSIGDSAAQIMRALSAPQNPPIQQAGKEITYSDITQEFNRFTNFSPMTGGDLTRKPSEALLERLLHPETYDPLSFAQSEAILAIAQDKNLNIVANLPDSVITFFDAMSAKSKTTTDAALARLGDGKETVTATSGNWLTITPSKPVEARGLRMNRTALAKLLSAAVSKELPSLDDYAQYALTNESPLETPIAMVYLIYFAPNSINQGMRGIRSWDMLRFYGLLAPADRQNLMRGGTIAYAGIVAKQRAILQKLLFGAAAKLLVDRPNRPPGDGGFFDMIRAFLPAESTDYRDEPTEVMPNGIPAGGYLEMKFAQEFVAVPAGKDGGSSRFWGALGADEVAMLKYFSEEPNYALYGSQVPKLEQMRLGTRKDYEFTFRCAPAVSVKQSLLDDSVDKSAQALNFEDWPAEFKARVQKRIEALKKSPFPFGVGDPAKPPPPLP